MTSLRTLRRARRRVRPSFWATLAEAFERAADDGASFCACADGRRCAV